MNTDDTFYDYLAGRLSPDEQKAWSRRLAEDSKLREEANELKVIYDAFVFDFEREMKSRMKMWEKQSAHRVDTRLYKNRWVWLGLVGVFIGVMLIFWMVNRPTAAEEPQWIAYYQPTLSGITRSVDVHVSEAYRRFVESTVADDYAAIRDALANIDDQDKNFNTAHSLYLDKLIEDKKYEDARDQAHAFMQDASLNEFTRSHAHWTYALMLMANDELDLAVDQLNQIAQSTESPYAQKATKLLASIKQ